MLNANADWLRRLVAVRVIEKSLVDDVMQEVNLAVLQSQSRPMEQNEIVAWLFKIALRQCALLIRTTTRRKNMLKRAALNLAESTTALNGEDLADPVYWLIEQEKRGRIRDAIQQLDPQMNELLKWKYEERLSYRQIAERLSVSIDTAEYRVLRARMRLRRILNKLFLSGED